MKIFDIASFGAQNAALALAILALTVLIGKRIYDSYFAAALRTGECQRSPDTLKMRLLLSVHAAALGLLLGLAFDQSTMALVTHMTAAAIVAAAPATYIYLRANWANDDVQKATDYTAVALGNFDKFIHTGGDLIGRKDLKITIEKGTQHASFAPSDIYVAKYLLANFEDVGHVIKSTTKKGLMPTGVPGGMYATKKTVRAYGISRDDLKNYSNVVRKRNARWL